MNLARAPFTAKLGLLIVTMYIIVGLLGPILAPFTQSEIVGSVWEPARFQLRFGSLDESLKENVIFGIPNVFQFIGGMSEFWLGTDNLGRDLWSRIIYGTRLTLFVALAASTISFLWGIFTGFLAAVSGGWVDQVLSRWVDMLIAFPTLIFALVVLSMVPINMTTLILVMATLDSTRVFRISRAIAQDTAVMDFVEAARLRGENTLWIIFREILPNTLTPLVAEFGLRFSFHILFLSSLSFLGLGIQPPNADWGGMVRENSAGISFGLTAALFPAAAIAILTVSVNFVVDWILDRTSSLRSDG